MKDYTHTLVENMEHRIKTVCDRLLLSEELDLGALSESLKTIQLDNITLARDLKEHWVEVKGFMMGLTGRQP